MLTIIEYDTQHITFQLQSRKLCYDRWRDVFWSANYKFSNIQKIATSQENHYTTSCLLDYNCFKKHYKMIERDLSKQQARDADPKIIQ